LVPKIVVLRSRDVAIPGISDPPIDHWFVKSREPLVARK
jgi:hypothetical protein